MIISFSKQNMETSYLFSIVKSFENDDDQKYTTDYTTKNVNLEHYLTMKLYKAIINN